MKDNEKGCFKRSLCFDAFSYNLQGFMCAHFAIPNMKKFGSDKNNNKVLKPRKLHLLPVQRAIQKLTSLVVDKISCC